MPFLSLIAIVPNDTKLDIQAGHSLVESIAVRSGKEEPTTLRVAKDTPMYSILHRIFVRLTLRVPLFCRRGSA
jgi:hypothetical protein